MDDRISQLPIPILHHILCSLSQKEALRTCVLSKQWRHIGSTRPNLDFSEERFNDTQEMSASVNCSSILQHILYQLCRPWSHRGSTRPNLNSSGSTEQNFFSVVNQTLQGYLDRNFSIHKLYLDFSRPDSPPAVSLLDKWIPMIAALSIKSFKLNSRSYTPAVNG
ncbi:F-box/LRR-repeat protein [Striga hermonthica]|uniref:F-box/LRR-repeat protein n=1 Tax=Striga hermonthica TaxID=68872 RepID=A0A9N7NN52_STRHE|nr:F-box/LRR-repeat protein [Striga hermonthica]